MNFLTRATFLVLVVFAAAALAQTAPADSDPVLLGAASYSMPQSAIDAKISGSLLIAVRVDETGKPTKVSIVSGLGWPCGTTPTTALEELSSTLSDTMMKLRFSPAIKDGKPVTRDVGIRVQLKNSNPSDGPVEVDPVTGKRRARQISGGVLNGKATRLPKPVYPAEARSNGESGAVTIQVLIDEEGRVIRAWGVSGAASLQLSAREAACKAEFSPIRLEGNPVKVSGVITYNFVP